MPSVIRYLLDHPGGVRIPGWMDGHPITIIFLWETALFTGVDPPR